MRIPSPQELGLLGSPASGPSMLDWNGAHRRLQQLGATGLYLAPLAEGGWSVTFALATARADKAHRIQAQAASPEAALHLALARADTWLAEARK